MTRQKPKGHKCNPPPLTRSKPSVDIVMWTCWCGRKFIKRFEVK